ncbi:MAG: hypothetical protein IGS48_03755 [Oscillatoriales cyanobacterium C42_A2020_001]|nr:hypothetical protein [Leptolyngbyaceae cyanobacterium C42_A2020_001]
MEQNSAHPQATPSPSVTRSVVSNRATSDTVMRWFNHLLQTRPMAFWGGVWVSVFLIGVVAVGSLMSPNASERRSVSAIAIGSDSVVATQPLEQKGKVPFWLFGAIAVTCTAGSFLVSRQLSPAASRPRLVRQASGQPVRKTVRQVVAAPAPARPKRRAKRSGSQPTARPPKPVNRQPKRLKPYSLQEAFFAGWSPQVDAVFPQVGITASGRSNQAYSGPTGRARHPLPQPTSTMRSVRSSVRPQTSEAPVTVVPADHVHPLDWHEPRLAESVDLRKRKSIKSWL